MKLPTILSGPIIRRAERDKVYIWIATSLPCTLHAELYTVTKKSFKDQYIYHPLGVTTETKTIRAGRHFYTHLLKLSPSEAAYFPTDILLGYNLSLETKSETFDLGKLGLLSQSNPERITYGNLQYPTFFINRKNNTNILYGSCRKTHGEGQDSLVKGDQEVSENYLLLTRRPSALFLLGDQIYADDIADPLIPFLKELGENIVGTKENLADVEQKLTEETYKISLDQIQGRRKISNELCKFTSTHAGNHLFRYGEFVSMYLLNWSPDLWSYLDIQKYVDYSGYYGDDRTPQNISTLKKLDEKQFYSHLNLLENFKKSLPQVRRLLANTPTYMIFDDHDITDDWNLSAKWKKEVWEAPLGRHVVANGLATYWLFQGWGNNPDSFHESFIETMKAYFRSLKVNSKAYNKWVHQLWNYSNWHFVAPTKPKAIFLDTRTQRAYDKGTDEGPRLLNEQSYKKITSFLPQNRKNRLSQLLLISPAPLLEMNEVEKLLKDYIYPLRSKGIPVHRELDLETWIFNSKGYSELIHWILKQSVDDVIVLSGDAHRGFSVGAKLKYKGRNVNLTQHTSSPFKNESFPSALKTISNALLSQEKETERYIDTSFEIHRDNKRDSKELLWQETVHNIPLADGSMMETDNNIGLLTIEDKSITSQLLKSNK